jgi:hypothetical protein
METVRLTMKVVATISGRQLDRDARDLAPSVGDPVGVTPDNSAQEDGSGGVILVVVIAQHHVAPTPVAVGHVEPGDGGAERTQLGLDPGGLPDEDALALSRLRAAALQGLHQTPCARRW